MQLPGYCNFGNEQNSSLQISEERQEFPASLM